MMLAIPPFSDCPKVFHVLLRHPIPPYEIIFSNLQNQAGTKAKLPYYIDNKIICDTG